ncbi:MAG: class I mannose-6-phosphate isomerase, partial [Clostridia bacterium]|nr:class I mannose-6-phosphate isomerase [Clostridia bacterium]
MKSIVKLSPTFKDYIWGGNKLRNYGKVTSLDKIAESWEVSAHKDGPSLTPDGKTIEEYFGASGLGKNVEGFEFFPLLIKLIDSADNLSVQVHPEDAYALKNEGQYGKTEMWYIVDSEEGAGIYLGFKNDTPKEVFEKAVEDGTVTGLLNFFPVKKGEFYFIKSGTVHAIGKGVTLCEIQQNSNLTYRVYDYKRKGADGKERPLHVEKALKVIDFSKFEKQSLSVDIGEKKLIGASKYFSTYQAAFEGEKNFVVDDKSFMTFTCVSGKGNIEGQRMSAGDSFMANA